MNEYLLYALLVIAAIALIGALYWLIKVRPIYQRLKRAIRVKAESVRELNVDLEQANILFRMKREVRRIEYLPPEMISRAKELSDIIAKGIGKLSKRTFPSVEDAEWFQRHEELYQLEETGGGFLGLAQAWSDHAYHWLWRGLSALVVFSRDRILGSLFPHPRGNLSKLRKLDEDWEKLVGYQRELLKLLQKLPGSAEFLDAKEKARLAKKAEKERREQAIASIEQAKNRLEEAINYIRLRHSERSVSIGELPITSGTSNLTLSMLEQYWEREMAKVNDMIQRAVDPHEIVGYISSFVLPNLEGLFEEKAKEVARAEFSAGELQGRMKQLSEDAGKELIIPVHVEKAFMVLGSEIPSLWSQARWREFDRLLEVVLENFEEGNSYLKEAAEWLEEIDSFRARIAGVKVKETRLKETYGIEVAASPDWGRTAENFENEAFPLWSGARFDLLDAYLKTLETPLRQHQFKVTNRLAEADREAGVTPPRTEEENDFRSKLDQIASVADGHSPSTPRRHQQPEPQRRLTGTFVKHRTALGVEMEIDESMLKYYQQMDAKQAEEAKKAKD